MTTIYCYVGLPGSGKTYTAKKDQEVLGGLLLDDKFTLEDLSQAFENNVPYIFITEPNLCIEDMRDSFVRHVAMRKETETPVSFKWFWFENDPDKAIKNIINRNDGREVSLDAVKYYYSKQYDLPPYREVIPIWQPPVVNSEKL